MTTTTLTRHHHEVDVEEASGPDRTGTLLVAQVCSCGIVLGTYTDSVL